MPAPARLFLPGILIMTAACDHASEPDCPGNFAQLDPACAYAWCLHHPTDPACARDAALPFDATASLDACADAQPDTGCTTCRECASSEGCAARTDGKPHCAASGSCVQCETLAQCTSEEAPRCASTGLHRGCGLHALCADPRV